MILLIGSPCSGKTTWAKQYIASNENTIRISRDDLRLMMRNRLITHSDIEMIITRTSFDLIYDADKFGLDVIIDQTNCKWKYIHEFMDKFGHLFDIKFKVFKVGIDTLKARNQERSRLTGIEMIPNRVIEAMYDNQISLLNSPEFKQLEADERLV